MNVQKLLRFKRGLKKKRKRSVIWMRLTAGSNFFFVKSRPSRRYLSKTHSFDGSDLTIHFLWRAVWRSVTTGRPSGLIFSWHSSLEREWFWNASLSFSSRFGLLFKGVIFLWIPKPGQGAYLFQPGSFLGMGLCFSLLLCPSSCCR